MSATTSAAKPAASSTFSGRFETISRAHAADAIFDQLAQAILRGDFAAGASLPPERELADQFGVSRTIARQALHRIAELGMIRMRQGGATVVQDCSEATDDRLIELRFRLGPTSPTEERDIFERRILEGFALVQLASMRATQEELAAIEARIDDFAARGSPEEEDTAFEQYFWSAMAQASHNRLYVGQSAWWSRLVGERGSEPTQRRLPTALRMAFYKRLVRRIIDRADPAQFFLDTVRPLLDGSC